MKRIGQDERHKASFFSSRFNIKSILTAIIIIFFLLVCVFKLLSKPISLKVSSNTITKRIVIPYLTCAKTCHRNKYYVAPMINLSLEENSSILSYVISDSQKALDTARKGILSPNCTGGRMSANGNACRFDMTFKHFYFETNSPWLLVAIDDTFLNIKNLFRLLDVLESMYNPFEDQVMLGQVHHDWGTNFPHGGPGLLYSRAWVSEFFRQNMSFEIVHQNNFRYTYDITTGLLALNYFPKSIWIDHPWIIVVMPEKDSTKALLTKNWSILNKCQKKWGRLPRLQDVSQFHISPFEKDSNFLAPPSIDDAPPHVKVYRPQNYAIRFCIQKDIENDLLINKDTINKSIVNCKSINKADVKKRIKKTGSSLPF